MSRLRVVILLLFVIGLVGIVIHEYRSAPPYVGPPSIPQNEDLLNKWDAGHFLGLTDGMDEQDVIDLFGSPDKVIWPGQDNAREKTMPSLQAGEKYLVYRSHALKISNGKTNGEYKVETITVHK